MEAEQPSNVHHRQNLTTRTSLWVCVCVLFLQRTFSLMMMLGGISPSEKVLGPAALHEASQLTDVLSVCVSAGTFGLPA